MSPTDAKSRINALRQLLSQGKLSTQEELAEELGEKGFEITQSTISRDLRKLGAIKAIDPNGRTVYKLPPEPASPVSTGALEDLVLRTEHNGSLIVIHTAPGSASLVARHLDTAGLTSIIGTIAGDDCIFVAPADTRSIRATLKDIAESLR